MAEKFMYTYNDNTQNFHFCRLQLEVEIYKHFHNNEPNNQNLIGIVPKVVEPMNGKRY